MQLTNYLFCSLRHEVYHAHCRPYANLFNIWASFKLLEMVFLCTGNKEGKFQIFAYIRRFFFSTIFLLNQKPSLVRGHADYVRL